MIASMLCLWIVLREARSDGAAVLAIAALTLSPVFVTFSTSGLESPLLHLLGALLVVGALHFRGSASSLVWLASLTALIALTRWTALLFALPVLLPMLSGTTRRTKLTVVAVAIGPLTLWLLWSRWDDGAPGPIAWLARRDRRIRGHAGSKAAWALPSRDGAVSILFLRPARSAADCWPESLPPGRGRWIALGGLFVRPLDGVIVAGRMAGRDLHRAVHARDRAHHPAGPVRPVAFVSGMLATAACSWAFDAEPRTMPTVVHGPDARRSGTNALTREREWASVDRARCSTTRYGVRLATEAVEHEELMAQGESVVRSSASGPWYRAAGVTLLRFRLGVKSPVAREVFTGERCGGGIERRIPRVSTQLPRRPLHHRAALGQLGNETFGLRMRALDEPETGRRRRVAEEVIRVGSVIGRTWKSALA